MYNVGIELCVQNFVNLDEYVHVLYMYVVVSS